MAYHDSVHHPDCLSDGDCHPHCLERGKAILASGAPSRRDQVINVPARPTFDQLWLTLCPGSEESGVVLISEIVDVVRFADIMPSGMRGVPDRKVPSKRGVAITFKSGEIIEAPDAIYAEVKMAIMAAEVAA